MKYLIVVVLVILGVWGYFYALPNSTPQILKPKVDFKENALEVSPQLQEYFPQLKSQYKGKELQLLFESLNSSGNHVCRMIYGRQPFNEELYDSFTSIESKNFLSKLILGCHNFFKMNDVFLVEMLNKVYQVYGNKEKDCYSVGFSQIYLMATELNCTSITAIDVDWRILWAHHQAFESYLSKGILDFNSLRVGWSADFSGSIKENELKVKTSTFCYGSDIKNCSTAFKSFSPSELDFLGLQLAFLHQVKFTGKNKLILFYVSNAIDPGYTSEIQFEELLNNIKNSIDYIQKVVVVYHGGGSKQFGIYEVRRIRETDSVRVTTVCRDDYVWSSSYSTRGQKYRTYFDKVSDIISPEECL